MVVVGTIRSFLEPFCGHLSPKIDKVSEELTLRYPHKGPCVGMGPLSGVRGSHSPSISGCYVTKSAPHKALKLIE